MFHYNRNRSLKELPFVSNYIREDPEIRSCQSGRIFRQNDKIFYAGMKKSLPFIYYMLASTF